MKLIFTTAAVAIVTAMVCCACTLAGTLERLPDPDLLGPAVTETPTFAPNPTLVPELGFLDRWRAAHQERAARDGMIKTDRPSFTLSDSTVPRGWLQLETGWNYAYSHQTFVDNGRLMDFNQNVNYLPQLNLRYGLTSWAELRVEWAGVAIVQQQIRQASTGMIYADGTFTELADLGVGAKLQVSRQRGYIPTSAFVTELYLPTSGGNVTPLVDYIYTWQLGESFSLGGSSGMVLGNIGSGEVDHFFQSVIFRYHYSPRFTWYAEYYGTLEKYSGDSSWFPMFDTGIQWRLRPNFQLDARVGTPLGGEYQSDGVFTGAGASVRY